MSNVLHPHWYRVSTLHPRLAPGVSAHRQPVRGGEVDYVLRDAASGRSMRVNAPAYGLVGRMSGAQTFEQIWRAAVVTAGDQAPTQGESIDVLSTLVERGLVRCETTADSVQLLERERGERRQRFSAALNPMSLRIPLGNPVRFIEAVARGLPNWTARTWALLWLALMSLTVFVLADAWGAAGDHARQLAQAPRSLLLLWLAYPVVKLLHEMAHAMALRAFGGQAREVGLNLMMGVPVPYVDASDADTFPRRRERMAVAGAGIAAELALAALAAFVWLVVQPGVVRDLAMTVMLIGGVSTVVFNGNPLMRLDGYHVLADAVGVPNLAARSQAVWLRLLRQLLAGAKEAPLPESRTTQAWLAVYGVLSTGYRLLVGFAVVAWAGGFSTLLALALGAMFLFGLVLRPLLRSVNWLARSPQLQKARSRHVARVVAAVGGALLVLAVVPLPMHLVAQGVVWLPPEAEVRAEEDGFITRIEAHDGQAVQRGQLLLQMDEPKLVAALEKAQQRLTGLDVEFNEALMTQSARAQTVAAGIESAQAERDRAQQRLDALAVRAGADGTLALSRAEHWPGRFARKGDVIAHLLNDDLVVVRAAVAQADIDLLKQAPDAVARVVSVRLADEPGRERSATLLRETPAATRQIPAPALGELAGGPIAQDPSDRTGRTALQPLHVVDVRLDAVDVQRLGGRIGTRANVRFDLPAQPLLQRAVRAVRQLFLSHFSRDT
jgi:putative peptide zinc metalloprotease protein